MLALAAIQNIVSKRIALFIFILVFSFLTQLHSQKKISISGTQSPPTYIRNVLISGNETTEEIVIQRELTFTPGDTIKAGLLTYNTSRIYSLGLFNNVDILPEAVATDSVDVHIFVNERWYIFPFPVFGMYEGDFKKMYYGATIFHTNFRGRNEKIACSLVFGYNPFVSLYYFNPLVYDEPQLFLETQLISQTVRNLSSRTKQNGMNYNEHHYTAYINFGSRFDVFRRMTFGAEFNSVQVKQWFPNRTISNKGIDNYFSLRMNYSYDTRDLVPYAGYGSYVRATFAKLGLEDNGVNFSRLYFDYRRYFPLTLNSTYTIIIATRMFSTMSEGKQLPVYEHLYFGYSERLRGHYAKVMEGDNLAGSSIEIRLPLFSPKIFKVNFIPIIQFSVLRFGMYAALFGNIGAVQFQPMKFNEYMFAKGYGAGIHFILPYDIVLRTEVALNEVRNSEFIIELGTSF
ncbi:MAG: hypothetical protein FJ218_09350 [Ignavibacteria bacterium]|nr:hypothetical protein [Ignavibacteria bacterium]